MRVLQANASEQFQECKMAYQILIDSASRDKYNRELVSVFWTPIATGHSMTSQNLWLVCMFSQQVM